MFNFNLYTSIMAGMSYAAASLVIVVILVAIFAPWLFLLIPPVWTVCKAVIKAVIAVIKKVGGWIISAICWPFKKLRDHVSYRRASYDLCNEANMTAEANRKKIQSGHKRSDDAAGRKSPTRGYLSAENDDFYEIEYNDRDDGRGLGME